MTGQGRYISACIDINKEIILEVTDNRPLSLNIHQVIINDYRVNIL
jgi:hypothetical protein